MYPLPSEKVTRMRQASAFASTSTAAVGDEFGRAVDGLSDVPLSKTAVPPPGAAKFPAILNRKQYVPISNSFSIPIS